LGWNVLDLPMQQKPTDSYRQDFEEVVIKSELEKALRGINDFLTDDQVEELVDKITTAEQKSAVQAYKAEVAAKSDLERTELNKDKSGVFTGAFATNPVNGKQIPVWIADYVLMSYGTGAIMAVPAHDERDFEFAKKFGLPIVPVFLDNLIQYDDKTRNLSDSYKGSVITQKSLKLKAGASQTSDKDLFAAMKAQSGKRLEDAAIVGEGIMFDSGDFSGMETSQVKEEMIKWLEKEGKGERKINYKLRDWIFTRQRYWGEPIPVVFDEAGQHYPLDDSQLPLELPETPNYEPSADGQSPLAKIQTWVNVKGDITADGTVVISENGSQNFTRETSTMPNWAGSSWYWLRFMDAQNEQEFCSKEKSDYWGPVDLYVGGAEHAVLHLLYGRFWHKVLFDLGLVATAEPFKKLVNQGMIAAEDGRKMSKSLGNVINPDDVVAEFGADTLRCYEMFMGPFEQGKAWSMGSVGGIRKWLERVARVFDKVSDDAQLDKPTNSTLHKTIKQVGDNIDDFKFNTAISQMMVLTNELTALDEVPKDALEKFAILLSPFAPHLAEELWAETLGNPAGISFEAWPQFDEAMLVEDTVTYAVQVNGKLRGELQAAAEAGKDEVLAEAKQLENVAKWLNEGDIKKEIFVPGKIIGFVVA